MWLFLLVPFRRQKCLRLNQLCWMLNLILCLLVLQVGRWLYVLITRINEDTNDLILSEKNAWVSLLINIVPSAVMYYLLTFKLLMTFSSCVFVYCILVFFPLTFWRFLLILCRRNFVICGREHSLREQSGKFFLMVLKSG